MVELQDTGERLIPDGHLKTLTYGEHLARYLSASSLVKNKTVLDLASGTGYGTKILSKTAKKVYGVDYSKSAVNYAKNHYYSKNIEYLVGDATKIPINDKSIDLVVSLETIEHLTDPEKFVNEVKRVLKDDGVFIVSTPNDDEFIEGNEFHLHEFNLKELEKLIKKNFKKNKFYYQGSFFASALLSEQSFTSDGNLNAIVEKTFGENKDKAIYFIAVASNSLVPYLSQSVVISDSWSTKDDLERDKNRTIHLSKLDLQIQTLHQDKSELQNRVASLEVSKKELDLIKNSNGWKIISKLYSARAKILRFFSSK